MNNNSQSLGRISFVTAVLVISAASIVFLLYPGLILVPLCGGWIQSTEFRIKAEPLWSADLLLLSHHPTQRWNKYFQGESEYHSFWNIIRNYSGFEGRHYSNIQIIIFNTLKYYLDTVQCSSMHCSFMYENSDLREKYSNLTPNICCTSALLLYIIWCWDNPLSWYWY